MVAAADYAHQRAEFMRQMRMSRQELLDELKQSDGDPHTKQRLRALRLERARRRMIADVPRATVVVTNPTHFAVALRYVVGETAAPEVLAKGVDTLALKIRKIAAENGIPVIENAAARPRSARRLRRRRRDPAGALPGGGRDHLLRAPPGRAPDARPSHTAVLAALRRPPRGKISFISPRMLAPMQTPRAGQAPPKHGAANLRRLAQAALLAAAGMAADPGRGGSDPPVRHRRVPRRIPSTPCRNGGACSSGPTRRTAIMRACAADAEHCPNRATLAWAALLRGLDGVPPRAQVEAVNRFVNGWTYRADADNYGRSDYWATPLEFFRRSGDCEDYVIAKYRSLRLLGLPRRAAAHGGGAGRRARPAARRAGGLSRRRGLILDNLSEAVLPQQRVGQLRALLLGQRGCPLGAHAARRAGRRRRAIAGVQPAQP